MEIVREILLRSSRGRVIQIGRKITPSTGIRLIVIRFVRDIVNGLPFSGFPSFNRGLGFVSSSAVSERYLALTRV